MNQEEKFDDIDMYLWRTAPNDEQTAFEKEMAADKDLAEEVTLRRLENQAMRLKAQDDLRAKMKAWKTEAATTETVDNEEVKIVSLTPSIQGRVVRLTPMRWAAAATVLIVVALSTAYWGQTNYSDSAIATQFFDVNSAILRGGEKSRFDEAADLMDKGKNSEAIAVLQELKKDSVSFENAAFMLAEAYFKSKKYSEASAVYKEIMDRSADIILVQRADFQELIMQLAAGSSDSGFKNDLSRIANDNNHAFQPQAIALKAKIESAWKKVF